MKPAAGLVGVLLTVTMLITTAAAAERLVGRARAVDGDTLEVGGVRVRLEGVAAPELHEKGGPAAKAFVTQLVDGQVLVCELTGARTQRRRVGVCRRGKEDVGAAVISAGLARDCSRFSSGRYAKLETPAGRRLPLPTYCEKK